MRLQWLVPRVKSIHVICKPVTYIDPFNKKCLTNWMTNNKLVSYPIFSVYWAHPPKGDRIWNVSPPALRINNIVTLVDN